MMEEIVHIPLGLDCTVAYQLQQHNLRYQSLPFDWIKVNNVQSIIEILNDQFFKFFDEKEWIVSHQSNNFDYFGIDIETINHIKSKLKLKHKTYKIVLPHESINDEINLSIVLKKYQKRSNRFNELLKSNIIKKIYIGCNGTPEKNKDAMKLCLDNYGCINYQIIIIDYDRYPTTDLYSWHRNWIPWQKIFAELCDV